ncbi:MAG TPA: hypothetical protein VNS09_15365 [Solirubrobacter sp.]|nr:hypothetical protein [Solirubrobacter sp.]
MPGLTRLRAQEGMSLPELLIALVMAMIISLATFALVDTVMSRTGDVATRVDTTQRGRAAMDFITRQLRSQVCVLATTPAMTDDRLIYSATPTTITFFSDLSDESTAGTPTAPELRSISLEDGELIERHYTGVQNPNTQNHPTYAYSGYPDSPAQTRVLADDIATVDTTTSGQQPLVFRYYRYDDSGKPQAEMDATTPLFNQDASLIAAIDVSFRATRSRGNAKDPGSTVFRNSVYVRNADPNAKNPRPMCAL